MRKYLALFIVTVLNFVFASTICAFEACKNIKIIDDTTGSKVMCEVCPAKVNEQYAPTASLFKGGFEGLAFSGSAMGFLSQVADEAASNMDKSIIELNALKLCVNANAGKNCNKQLSALNSNLDNYTRDLKKSMLLVHANRSQAEQINKNLSNVDIFTPNPIKGLKVSLEEIQSSKDAIDDATAIGNGRCELKKNEVNGNLKARGFKKELPFECKDFVRQELNNLASANSNRVKEILYGAMPLMAFLKDAKVDANGKYFYSPASISSAIDQLIANAKKEKALALKAKNDQSLEFGAFNLERFKKATLKGERDLMDYIAFTPMVEAVLKKNPKYCGLATGLARRADVRSTQYGIGSAGLMITGFFTAGLGSAVAGAGVLGAEVLTLAGAATGMGFVGISYADFSRAKQQTMTGIDPDKRIQDSSKVLEAEKALRLSLGFHPLDYIGAGAAGNALGKAMANNLKTAAAIFKTNSKAAAGVRLVVKDFLKSLTSGKASDKLLNTMAGKGKVFQEKMVEFLEKYKLSPRQKQALAVCLSGTPESSKACKEIEPILLKLENGEAPLIIKTDASEGTKIKWDAIPLKEMSEVDGSLVKVRYSEQHRDLSSIFLHDNSFKKIAEKDPKEAEDLISYLLYKMEQRGMSESEIKSKLVKIMNCKPPVP